ncbi:ferredoxin [Bradyrhizobium yuanmingense]|uniref:ferredoxin n=1 Tax=Bradyrhizobium yuanmingense TaxID=108015 RepID=UPI0012E3A59F
MMTRVVANRDRCVGAGICALTAPNLFDQDKDGRVLLLTEGALNDAEQSLVKRSRYAHRGRCRRCENRRTARRCDRAIQRSACGAAQSSNMRVKMEGACEYENRS